MESQREMRMLRWMCGATKKDNIRNEHTRGSVKVAPVTKKITEKRLKWYGHVKGRDEDDGKSSKRGRRRKNALTKCSCLLTG